MNIEERYNIVLGLLKNAWENLEVEIADNCLLTVDGLKEDKLGALVDYIMNDEIAPREMTYSLTHGQYDDFEEAMNFYYEANELDWAMSRYPVQ